MNILIVDDNAINRKLLCAQLEAEGHTILLASDGTEALNVLERELVHAVISDILMPDMDGYRLCYEIRAREKLRIIPVVLYSATYTSPADQRLAQTVGADVFLMKPAPAKQLLEALDEAARNAERRTTTTATSTTENQLYIMKEYNVALVNKLEEKNADVELTLEKLQRAHEHIMELNKGLEHRVQERTAELESANKQLQQALGEVKTLSGLLPICGNCKKIRDDKGNWHQVEGYLMKHSEATFTHGICDECGEKLYGEQYLKARGQLNENKHR